MYFSTQECTCQSEFTVLYRHITTVTKLSVIYILLLISTALATS